MRYFTTSMTFGMILFLTPSPMQAQHHGGGHHGGGHHGGGRHVPIHHGVRYGHHNWHHVVPHRPAHHGHQARIGAYYTIGQTHYYTPSPIVPIVTMTTTPSAPPPQVIEAQKPVELSFGGFSRIEDLAGRLAFEANLLCLDMHYNYRHNKNFAEAYREAYGILQAAKYVEGREHQGNRDLIRARMMEVDKLFHHVQGEMRAWTRAVAKPIGPDELPEKQASVEAVLHHLCFDAGVKPHEQPAEAAPAPAIPNEVAPPPPPPA